MSDSVRPHRRQPTRLPRPWDSPGKNTGVGCHFFLQWMKVKSESEVAQSCPTLCDPMDCSLPGSSIHGIFQERVLKWAAIAISIMSIFSGYFRDFSLALSHAILMCLNSIFFIFLMFEFHCSSWIFELLTSWNLENIRLALLEIFPTLNLWLGNSHLNLKAWSFLTVLWCSAYSYSVHFLYVSFCLCFFN